MMESNRGKCLLFVPLRLCVQGFCFLTNEYHEKMFALVLQVMGQCLFGPCSL